MGESYREAARRRERERRAAQARYNIGLLNDRIAQYEQAKGAVEAARNDCDFEKGQWESTSRQLAEKQVLKTNIFEGSMAKALQERHGSAVEENTRGIQSANNLIGALEGQISSVDGRIAELEQDISYWTTRL